MSGFIKTGLGVVTGFFSGGTSTWLPYVIAAGLVAGGTGFGMWKLIVAPRLEAAELRVTAAEKGLAVVVDANAETQRSIRVMVRQAEYDRKVTAAAIADAQEKAARASQVKRDIANVKGAQDAVDPVELYGNQRLRDLRAAARSRQNGSAIPVPARGIPALPGRSGAAGG